MDKIGISVIHSSYPFEYNGANGKLILLMNT